MGNTKNRPENDRQIREKSGRARRKGRRRGVVAGLVVTLLCVALVEVPLAVHFLRPDSPPETETEETAPSCDFTSPWYEQYRIVTHALGTVEGRTETNSREAFIESYESGARVFEADMSLTADGYLVVRHDFASTSFWNLEQTMDENMFYSDYINAKIGYFYTPLDIDGLLKLMKEYPDTYLVTDTKEYEEDGVRETFRRFREALERAGDETLQDRIIVQLYHYDMYEWVKEETDLDNFLFTLYQLPDKNYVKIGQFCEENGVPVVTLPETILEEKNVRVLHEYGVKVYAHTVNRIADMIRDTETYGVDGFYSDYVMPAQYEAVMRTQNTDSGNDLSYGEY